MKPRTRSVVAAVGVGIGAAVVGLSPWLVTGMRLPLQNLGDDQSLPYDLPIALLPFNQYYLLAVFGMLTLPGGIVGVVLRHRLHGGWRRHSVGPILCGVLGILAVQLTATVQTMMVVAPVLRDGWESRVYLTAIGAALVVAVLLGVVIALLIARGSHGPAAIAAAVAALALGCWISAFPDVALRLPQFVELARVLATAVPAVATGIALIWCGWRPTRRLGGWVGALFVLWAGGAVLQGLYATVSNRAFLGDFGAMTEAGLRAMGGSLLSDWIAPLVALGIGVVGSYIWTVSRD